MSTVVRETSETKIRVEMAKGTGKASIDTELPFFSHMLNTLARYSGLDLTVQAKGDLTHHLMEDVAIAMGAAFAQIVPATARRYGDHFVPMDDALVHAVVDIGGRFYFRGRLPSRLYTHWMRSFAEHGRMTLHLRLLRGKDRHHLIEAAFKAVGLSLREALEDSGAVFSTKGAVKWEIKG
jgi:imidazoleglycerol-phosphate dehydratase